MSPRPGRCSGMAAYTDNKGGEAPAILFQFP